MDRYPARMKNQLLSDGATLEDGTYKDQGNNQFLMEDSSSDDSDFSIATSKSLSNISKKNKFLNYPASRHHLQSQDKEKGPSKSMLPRKCSTSDRDFRMTKDFLYNLSSNSLLDSKSHLYVKLEAIRNSLINYQQKHHIYVHSYDFISLLTTILLLCGKALHCVLHINIALLPLYEILIHVSRFILEQIVLITETRSSQEKLKVSIICCLQSMALLVVTTFIYGSVLIPIFVIGMSIFWKIGYFLLL